MRKTIIFFILLSFISVGIAGIDYECGDINNDNKINIMDVVFLINYLYNDGAPPAYPGLADVNNSGSINLLDGIHLIDYLYKSSVYLTCPEIGETPSGTLTDYNGCKVFTAAKSETPPDQDCMFYDYDGLSGTLNLSHVNAGFNCCPSELAADIIITDDTISIYEEELFDSLGGCYCLCLFDVNYEITDLEPGQYVIKVIGLCLEFEEDTLVFDVDLSAEPSGSYCAARTHYPWGFEQQTSGYITSSTGCKSFGAKDDTTVEQDCIVYDYDGSGNLSIVHVNDLFNCCPESLYIEVNVEDNVLTIDEYETDGLCDCVCLFDIGYQIVSLPPDNYTIIVNNVYYYGGYYNEEPIQFLVDFTGPASGEVCVDRPYIPMLQ